METDLPWQFFQAATFVSSGTFKKERPAGINKHTQRKIHLWIDFLLLWLKVKFKNNLCLFSRGKIPGPDILTSEQKPFQYGSHLRGCCCRRWWAAGPAEGGDVTCDLCEVTDVAGLTEAVTCDVVGFALGITGPAAWGPHTFSTWGRDSWQACAWERLMTTTWVLFSDLEQQLQNYSKVPLHRHQDFKQDVI